MDKIAIQSCTENWDKMTPVEQGKHCSKCNKIVHQVSHLSNAQIQNKWQKNDKSLCIRIPKKRTIEVPKPFLTRWKYAIIASIIAIWLNVKNNILVAQGLKPKAIEEPKDQIISNCQLSGLVVDSLENMAPIPFAFIKVQLPDGSIEGAYTDTSGRFYLNISKELSASDSIKISCSMIGYQTSTQTTKVQDSINLEVFLAQNHFCLKEHVITIDRKIIQGIMINDWTQGVAIDRRTLYRKKIIDDFDTKTYHHDEIERYNLGR